MASREVREKWWTRKSYRYRSLGTFGWERRWGTATDVDRKFKLLIPADTATLVVSFIGMKTEIVKIPRLKAGVEQKELTIVLRGRGRETGRRGGDGYFHS